MVILDVIFIGILEVIIMYLIANALLGFALENKQILRIALIYTAGHYFIKSYTPQELNIVLIFILYSTLYCIQSKANIINAFMALSISYVIKFVSEIIVIIAFILVGIELSSILDNQITKIIVGNIILIIPFMVYKYICRKKIIICNYIKNQSTKTSFSEIYIQENINTNIISILLSVTNVALISSIVTVINMNVFIVDKSHSLKMLIIIMCGSLCQTYLIIRVFTLQHNKKNMQVENNLMKNNLNQMKETQDLLNIQKHDYMNHLQVILMQVSKGKNEEARRYILGISEDIKNRDNVSNFDTGSNYIDSILNVKSTKCIEHNIELTACIDDILEDTSLEDAQLGSIFLNIIDNAIDVLKDDKKCYKYIQVDTYVKDEKHIISISNNGKKIDNTKMIFRRGYSSKGTDRGYGLYSIKQMIEKNRGKIDVYSNDEETEFTVTLPITNKEFKEKIKRDVS